MQCPVCRDVSLVMSERSGVEIDYCPSCRGVWLDRGELDKIIERSATQSHSQKEQQPSYGQKNHYEKPRYEDAPRSHDGYYKKKKESFLADIFDF